MIARSLHDQPFIAKSKPSSNGLLSGLVAYYKLNDTTTGNGFVWLDSTGNGWGATQHGAFVQSDATTFKLDGGSAKDLSSGSNSGMATGIMDARAATTPWTIICWCLDGGNAFGNSLLSSRDVGANQNWQLYMGDSSGGSGGGNFVSLQTWLTSSGTYSGAITASSPLTGGSTFDLIVAGFDGTNRFISINNGTRVTSAVASVGRGGIGLQLMVRGDFLASWLGHLGPVAYYSRALSTSEQSLIWNGGAGIPFSSYS